MWRRGNGDVNLRDTLKDRFILGSVPLTLKVYPPHPLSFFRDLLLIFFSLFKILFSGLSELERGREYLNVTSDPPLESQQPLGISSPGGFMS